jgi:BASS family bile acid:Na+ symporter
MEDSLVTTLLLPIALAIIMLSLGLELTTADFRRVLTAPRGVAIGMLNLALISPALAFGMAELFALGPALAVGLVLLGTAPGGTLANMLTHLARGDTALSITMTAVSSLCAIVTVPLALELASSHFDAERFVDDISMAGIVARVLLITVIPVSIGMALAHRHPQRVAELLPRVKRVAIGTFVVVIAGAVVAEHERALDHLGEVAAAALALNLAAMTVSFTLSKLVRLGDRQATAIALELGIHNAALAIAVGATLSPELTIPAAVYSGFMVATGGLFTLLMSRRNAPARTAAA